jgi:hypothetical protein
MFVKCYEYLHPFVKSFVEQDVFDHDCNLDISEQTANIIKPIKELMYMELLIFRRYQIDVEDIKCLLQW